MPKHYFVHYTAGENWIPGLSVFKQPLQAHFEYLKELHKSGKLYAAGPALDDSGGLAMIIAESESEAHQIIRDDPAVRDGIMKADFHPWQPLDWAGITSP